MAPREFATSRGAVLSYDTAGEGPVLVALHGAYSTHQEVRAFLDPMVLDWRRIFVDLPGMGDSTAEGVDSAADAVTVLEELVDHEVGSSRFAIVGHSFGAHIARGLTARRPQQVSGLALICPLVPEEMHAERHLVVDSHGGAPMLPPGQAEEFAHYFVVQNEMTAARFREAVLPTLGRYDAAAVARQMELGDLDLGTTAYPGPVLVLTGRSDSMVGYRQHAILLDAYPGATSIVLADAGHALPHEQPEVLTVAIRHWAARMGVVMTERPPVSHDRRSR